MKNRICLLFMLTAVMYGCQKSETAFPQSTDSTYKAYVEQYDVDVKTAMTSDRKIVWTIDDRIAVFYGTASLHEFVLDNAYAGTPKGLFSPATSNQDASGNSGMSHVVAFYPYSSELTVETESGQYVLGGYCIPSVQRYTEGTFSAGIYPMIAVEESGVENNLHFKNVLGVMRLQFKGSLVVKTVKVEGNNCERLSGKAVVIADADNNPSVLMDVSASSNIVLDCQEGVALSGETSTDFLLTLPPVLFDEGFTVTVTDADDKEYKIVAGIANEVRRSSVLVMPEVDLDEIEPVAPAEVRKVKSIKRIDDELRVDEWHYTYDDHGRICTVVTTAEDSGPMNYKEKCTFNYTYLQDCVTLEGLYETSWDTSTASFTYNLDACGRAVTMADEWDTCVLSYDDMGHLVSLCYPELYEELTYVYEGGEVKKMVFRNLETGDTEEQEISGWCPNRYAIPNVSVDFNKIFFYDQMEWPDECDANCGVVNFGFCAGEYLIETPYYEDDVYYFKVDWNDGYEICEGEKWYNASNTSYEFDENGYPVKLSAYVTKRALTDKKYNGELLERTYGEERVAVMTVEIEYVK